MAIQPDFMVRKKRILVLVSRGGGGHKTAADSLKQVLGDDYEIEINWVIADILRSLDALNRLTFGSYTGEDLYNLLLKRHLNKCLEWMMQVGKFFMRSDKVERAFEQYLSEQFPLPDLIISPTPYINYGIACAAHRWNIPFLIVPTDLDGSSFLLGFPREHLSDDFKIAMAYNDPHLVETTLQNMALREDQYAITGFPVRPACLRKYSEDELKSIRAKFYLFESHKTATLVMGAVGSNLIYEHVRVMSQLDPRSHHLQLQMNICVGQNQRMGKKIRKLLLNRGAKFLGKHTFLLPSGLVMHIRGFTKDIIELMAASDLIITKTGSCTVNEAIYLEKKLLLDNTKRSSARHLSWEKFNIPFVEKNGFGYGFTHSKQLLMLIPSLLKYPDRPKKDLELPNFEENIVRLVKQMIGS